MLERKRLLRNIKKSRGETVPGGTVRKHPGDFPVEEVVCMMDDIKGIDAHGLFPNKISRLLSGNDK